MQKHFNTILTKYKEFERDLMKKGQLPMKDTDIGFWAGTHLESAFEFFQRFNLQNYGSFIDLGSGDGRITLLASLFGCKAHGIEFDEKLSNIALVIKNTVNLPHFTNVHLKNDDFNHVDISNFDIVFVHPDKPFYRGLEAKLRRELSGKLIVANWEFFPSSLKKVDEQIIAGEKYTVFIRPLS